MERWWRDLPSARRFQRYGLVTFSLSLSQSSVEERSSVRRNINVFWLTDLFTL